VYGESGGERGEYTLALMVASSQALLGAAAAPATPAAAEWRKSVGSRKAAAAG
jgi:hypothetical protein